MDALVGLVDQVIPGSPTLAIATAVIFIAAGWIARRVAASIRRQGARLGAVERSLKSERNRRRQVEQCLREHGIRLPYWPDDPAELYAAYSGPGPWPEDGVPLPRADDEPATNHLQTQYFSRHALRKEPTP